MSQGIALCVQRLVFLPVLDFLFIHGDVLSFKLTLYIDSMEIVVYIFINCS